MFTANRITSAQYFGEQELLDRKPYELNICAAEKGSMLIFIPRIDISKVFLEQELDKVKSLRLVMFPNEEEIKSKILIIEKVMTMKKNAFLNATNTNFLPTSMRDFYIDPVTKKLYKWVQGIQQRTRVKLNTAIQQKPDGAGHSSANMSG